MLWKAIVVTFVVVGSLTEYASGSPHRGHKRDEVRRPIKEKANEVDLTIEDKAAIEAIFTNAIECLNSVFNPDTLQKDLDDAKARGNLDEFLKDNCAKSPQMRMCLDTMGADITPYLDDTLREQLAYLSKSNKQIMDYFCANEGASFSSFVKKSGPECFKETSPIQVCANKFNVPISSLEDIVSLALKNQCEMYNKVTTCVVESLKECPTNSSSKFAESFFNNMKSRNLCN